MRNDRERARDREIQELRNQVHNLTVRTTSLERTTLRHTDRDTERALPGTHRQATATTQYTPTVGDYVRFRPTKITPGGTGRITKIVRGFLLIQRDTGEKLQQAPHNVRLSRRPDRCPAEERSRNQQQQLTSKQPATTTHLETTAAATTANKATAEGEATTAPPETARAVFAATRRR